MNLSGRRAWAVVGLIVAFGWTYLLSGRSHDLANIHNDMVTIVAEWGAVIVLAIIAFGIQRRRPSDFGLEMFGWRELFWMIIALVGGYACVGIASRLVPMPAAAFSSLGIRRLASVPFSLRLGLVLTAGICEEFMFRGFGIEELGGLVGSVWLAGLISLLAFTFAHVDRYGFNLALLIPGIIGAFLTLLYLWRRNLPVCMLLHAIFDGFAILVLPMLLAGHGK